MLIQETTTKQADRAIEKVLHNNNDIMKPYMYREARVVPVVLSGTIYDVKAYWNEDARVREGFKAEPENDMIYVPNFFVKINGVFNSNKEYRELIKILKKNSIYFKGIDFAKRNLIGKKDNLIKIRKMIESSRVYDTNTLRGLLTEKELTDSILNTLNSYQANYIFDKLNMFMNLYVDKRKINPKTLLQFLYNVIYMDKGIVGKLQNWDYPYEVPKIVCFDDGKPDEEELDYLFLHFLNYVGMDVAIVSDTGRSSIETYSTRLKDTLNIIMLDKFKR